VSTLLPARGAPAPAGLEILAGPPRGGDRLLRDYLDGAQALAPFYAGHPGDIAAYRSKAAEVERRLAPAARGAVAEAIEPVGDAADRLARILGGDGFFVTTGQQPALLGGPLYTLYKTLGAIRLAEELETRLGRPVLALFWIGADDHDWDEANHVSFLDRGGHVHRSSVPGSANDIPHPLSERRWGRGVLHAVEEFTQTLPDTVDGDFVRAHVRAAYTPEATVAESFTATFRMLLEGQRIAMVSSAHPALRRAAAHVMVREAEHAVAHNTLLQAQTARLVSAGYPAQVVVGEGAANLMLVDEHGRDRLVRTADGWIARRTGRRFGHGELVRHIADSPERFSPNVLLRPVVENAVFPTIAYVAGPGELRYFAQIGCLFDAHGILPPVVAARPGAVLVEARVRRALDRLGLDPDDLRRPLDELISEQARAALPAGVADALAALRQTVRDGYARLADAALEVDTALEGPLRSARNESLRRAAAAEKRILRALKRRDADGVDLLRRAAASLYPGGAPQERVLTPLQFRAAYGPSFTPALAQAMDMAPVPVATWRGTGCGR
jgi:bacillithiol synthase